MTYSISQARKLRDKRQKDMADYLHIHVQTYRKIEKSRTRYHQAGENDFGIFEYAL